MGALIGDYLTYCLLGTTTAPVRACWPLDEASGNFADDSGNGFTATQTGVPTYRVTGPVINGEQMFGAGFVESVPEYAGASEAIDDGVTAFTLSFWFRSTSVTDGYALSMASGAGQNSWVVYWPGDGGIHLYLYQTDGASTHAAIQTGFGLYHNGAWHHAIYWFDGTDFRAKIDGGSTVEDSAHTGTWKGATTDPFQMGAQAGGSNSWTGELSCPAYWRAELSAAEMSMLYTGIPLTPPGRVIDYSAFPRSAMAA